MLSVLRSFFVSDESIISLVDLPEDVLVGVFKRLEDVKDIISLQSTCKRLLSIGRSLLVWEDRIQKDFSISLHATGDCSDDVLQALYRDNRASDPNPLRYWGVYTDGGCDQSALHYWVDNLFKPNDWSAFCSETSPNVNCIGVMIHGDLQSDLDDAAERDYMIHKCRIPFKQLYFGDLQTNEGIEAAVRSLEKLPTRSLVNFFNAFHADLVAGHEMGQLLLHGVPRSQIAAEKERLRAFAERVVSKPSIYSSGIWCMNNLSDPGDDMDHSAAMTQIPQVNLYDSALLNTVQRQPIESVTGIIESVELSRTGDFSCPCASGVLFAGQIDLKQLATSHDDMYEALKVSYSPKSSNLKGSDCQGFCHTDVSCEFDDMFEKGFVEAAVASGKLPPIRYKGNSSSGEWIEFEADKTSSQDSRCQSVGLTPVVWYRFKDKKELYYPPLHEAFFGGDLDFPDDLPQADEHPPSESDSEADSDGEHLAEWNSISEMEDDNEVPVDVAEAIRDIHRDKLVMKLRQRRNGNVVLLKLIRPENLMMEHHDMHSDPNIDISALILQGKKLTLPAGISCLP